MRTSRSSIEGLRVLISRRLRVRSRREWPKYSSGIDDLHSFNKYIFMAAQRAFEAELFAKQHYLKVLSAKSPVAIQRRLSSKPKSTQKTTME